MRVPLPARRAGWHRCHDCGVPLPPEVWRHSSKRCPGYSELWAIDAYVVIGENLAAYGGAGVLLAITAPGSETLDWDRSLCVVQVAHTCSGSLGCQVNPHMAEVWNETAQVRFTRSQREAKRLAGRELRRHGSKAAVSKLVSWWELQRRGVLHAHVVLPVESPEERFWSRAYVNAWRELAPRFWFGFVDGWEVISRKPLEARRLGMYTAGYAFGGDKGGKLPLHEAVKDMRLPSRTFHVNRRLTLATKKTMRNARLNRRIYAARQALCPWPTLCEAEMKAALSFMIRGQSVEICTKVGKWLYDELPAEARAP